MPNHIFSADACLKLCDALAKRSEVQLVAADVALDILSRLDSTALTITLLRMSLRKASYHALAITSSLNTSALPAEVHTGAWPCCARDLLLRAMMQERLY